MKKQAARQKKMKRRPIQKAKKVKITQRNKNKYRGWTTKVRPNLMI